MTQHSHCRRNLSSTTNRQRCLATLGEHLTTSTTLTTLRLRPLRSSASSRLLPVLLPRIPPTIAHPRPRTLIVLCAESVVNLRLVNCRPDERSRKISRADSHRSPGQRSLLRPPLYRVETREPRRYARRFQRPRQTRTGRRSTIPTSFSTHHIGRREPQGSPRAPHLPSSTLSRTPFAGRSP